MNFKLSFSSESVIPATSAPEAAGYYALAIGGDKYFLTYGAGAYSWRKIYPRRAIENEGETSFSTIQLALTAADEEGYEVFGFESESEVLL